MPIDSEDQNMSDTTTAADVTGTLSRLQLAQRRSGTPARLPSDESLLVAVRDLDPEDPEKNIWTFYRGDKYQQKQVDDGKPKKTAKEMDNLTDASPLLLYNNNYYTKNGLWHAIKHPNDSVWKNMDWKEQNNYKDKTFIDKTTAAGLTGERDNELIEIGRKDKKNGKGETVIGKDGKPETAPVFRLEGEAQKYETAAGTRKRDVAAKNPIAAGEQLPDCLPPLDPSGITKGFSRLPGDEYTGLTPYDLEADTGGTWRLKSILHGYQTIEHIDRTLGPDAAANRFADYAGDFRGYNKDTDTAYIKIGSEYFPVKEVIAEAPDHPAAKAARGKPSQDGLDHRMIFRMPEGNTFASAEWVAKNDRPYFDGVCKDHGINPKWGDFTPQWGTTQAKYNLHARVLIEREGILSEVVKEEDGRVKVGEGYIPEGKTVLETYQANKIFFDGDSKRGQRKTTFTSLTQTLNRGSQEKNQGKALDVPDEVAEILLHNSKESVDLVDLSEPQLPPGASRYNDRNDRIRGASAGLGGIG
jgi:hypothetical protein